MAADLKFAKTHEWIRPEDGGLATVGISAYAVAALTDLVFMQLPQVGRRVKGNEATRQIPIVLLTASVDNMEGKVKEARADDYLLKPFDYMELLEKVKRFLG